MALLLRLTDARQSEVQGACLITCVVTEPGVARARSTSAHLSPAPFPIPLNAAWQRAEVTVNHDSYQPMTLYLRREGTVMLWSDPCTVLENQGGDQRITMPLSRIRFAPGEVPPFGAPSGSERGIYIQQQQGTPQIYGGLNYLLQTVNRLRLPKTDEATSGCLTVPMPIADEGWPRLHFDESRVETNRGGAFVWLEYGGPASQPTEPRFLVAVWVPRPDTAISGNGVDMLAFFHPSTVNSVYPASTFPFRDKYPYAALGKPVIDPQTKEKLEAKVQPYALLGYKYLFTPTRLVPLSIASGKPLVIVMPIFPNAGGPQQGQPFKFRTGLYRLLLEVRQFLQREGYNGSSFTFNRFGGRVAPTADGMPVPPPPPAFSQVNRPMLAIRSIVVCGYSRASVPLEKLLSDTIAAPLREYPPALFGADTVEFDRLWQEFWDLDFHLDEKDTGIVRARYELALREWLGRRDTRRLRMIHSDFTLKGVAPDAYFPQMRKLLSTTPQIVRDPALAARWASEWRDPNGRWSALFFSDPFLRAKATGAAVPSFPLVTDPMPAIHGFTAQLGFGLASRLRKTP